MEIPEMYQTGYYNNNNQFTPEKRLSDAKNNGDHFIIEDLLDIPNDDMVAVDGGLDVAGNVVSTDSSYGTVAQDGSCNSSFSTAEPHYHHGAEIGAPTHFSGELCVPYDDVAELEWLSNIVEESFSSEDLQKLQLIQGMKVRTSESSEIHQYQFQPDTTRSGPMFRPEIPGKARSKRSRAAPVNWTSRLQVVTPTPSPSASECDSTTGKKGLKPGPTKKKEGPENSGNSEGRRCLHCATDKTPQWRTGPMGPKTLCNACGVRYKSGRLVPEYRPASSPTFVLAKHSNSHRKVLELRRQKEMQRAQQQHQFLQQHHHNHQSMMFGVGNSDDYLIHQHIGPDYRQLI